jgi:hypothetical protein
VEKFPLQGCGGLQRKLRFGDRREERGPDRTRSRVLNSPTRLAPPKGSTLHMKKKPVDVHRLALLYPLSSTSDPGPSQGSFNI